jgi:hypothetical protein
MSSSSEDIPLAARAAQLQKQPNSNGAAAGPSSNGARASAQPTPTSSRPASGDDDDSGDDASSSGSGSDASSSDSDDDVPLSQRQKKAAPAKAKPAAARKQQPAAKRKRESSAAAAAGPKRAKREGSRSASAKGGPKWSTLEHCGVMFPPEYEPHGVKMLYDGKPVELTPEQEEVASMFAIMKETDYMAKPTFLKNFWEGFQQVGAGLVGGWVNYGRYRRRANAYRQRGMLGGGWGGGGRGGHLEVGWHRCSGRVAAGAVCHPAQGWLVTDSSDSSSAALPRGCLTAGCSWQHQQAAGVGRASSKAVCAGRMHSSRRAGSSSSHCLVLVCTQVQPGALHSSGVACGQQGQARAGLSAG